MNLGIGANATTVIHETVVKHSVGDPAIPIVVAAVAVVIAVACAVYVLVAHRAAFTPEPSALQSKERP